MKKLIVLCFIGLSGLSGCAVAPHSASTMCPALFKIETPLYQSTMDSLDTKMDVLFSIKNNLPDLPDQVVVQKEMDSVQREANTLSDFNNKLNKSLEDIKVIQATSKLKGGK